MDISKADGRPQGRKSSYDEAPVSRATRRDEQLRRASAPLNDDLRNHFEDLKEKHRVLRHQYQVCGHAHFCWVVPWQTVWEGVT